jgi:hypothetical protein
LTYQEILVGQVEAINGVAQFGFIPCGIPIQVAPGEGFGSIDADRKVYSFPQGNPIQVLRKAKRVERQACAKHRKDNSRIQKPKEQPISSCSVKLNIFQIGVIPVAWQENS